MPVARVGENDLHYELRGSGDGLPAVLLMGLGTDLDGWNLIAPKLGGRRLLLIDNRGVGRSSKPRGPYTTEELAADTLAVMAAAGIERAHIVGISLGGAIAQRLVLAEPARVVSLALIATFVDLDAELQATADEGARKISGSAMNARQLLESMSASTVEIDPRAIFSFLMPMVFSRAFLEREKQMLTEMYERAMVHGISLQGFAGQLAAAYSHHALDELAGVEVPTLVVMPRKDRLIPPAQSQALARAIPGARLVELPEGVHGCVIEGEAELSAMLSDWLAEHDPPASPGR